MRVALVSTLRTAVPPPKTGSVELIVGLIASELARRGHEVTLFATGDSTAPVRVIPTLASGYHHDSSIWDWQLAEFMQLGRAYEHAAEFDVINSHVYIYGLPFSRLVSTPTVHTFHICPTPDYARFCAMFPDGRYLLLSDYQRQFFPGLPIAGVVPNGIDIRSFAFEPAPGRYLAFLGDFHPDKRPLDAIACARRAGVPIRLAGPATEYFRAVVKPEIDRNGSDVEYVGELDHDAKASLLGGAIALLFPVDAPEACPLVLLESMACGTPVLGLASGPTPELVEHGVTGLCVGSVPELAAAVEPVARLDRRAIRRAAEQRHDYSRMVDDYERIFEEAVASRRPEAR